MKTDTIKKRQRYEGGSGKKKKKRKKSKKSGSEEKHKKKKKRQKRIQEDHVDVSYSPTQPAASISSSSNTTMAPMAVTPSSSSSLLSNHPHHPQHQHHHHPSSVQQSPQPSPSSSTYALHQSPVSHTPPVSNFVTSATQLMLNFQAATANSAEVTPDFFQYQDYFGSSNFCPYFPDATSSASGQSTPQQHQSHHQQQ
ncbi:hypothetical protein BCR43DRAFT_487579 [Syncephalastrum racemosum]|uniref:Uncharacterized protein n=1 Tax=Syncephalastrum racemosum TaxID=13706 RepID=A0A1X2HHD0_SYNRA|nr:hypothetical protein BCR43DRAFT_487579 [Syncephalastrum racemosum]